MSKHHWRQQIKSFFESHADPDKHEQMKRSRKDMEEKKEKMIRLIRSEEQDGSNSNTETLEELIKDYHKQYDSLYEEYHHLTGELNKKLHSDNNGDKGKASSSSSDSDSDKESFSKVSKRGKSQAEFERLITNELQTKLEAANHEIDELKVEAAKWNQERLDLISENDKLKESESKLQRREKEASSKISALNTEIGNLKEELENESAELTRKVVDLELNLRSAERKADELSRGNQSNDQLVVELQTTIEDLKRDVEMDKDELMTIEEKNRNLEVMLRLSNQKLRVTEQLLSEKEASHERLGQTLEEYSGMIRYISEQLSTSLGEVERAINKKLNEDYGGLGKRVVTASKEIQNLKSWVAGSTRSDMVGGEGSVMRKTIEKMEEEGRKAKEEKEEAARYADEMDKAVKEKDERIWSLGEEKREAIRQLCVWTEYYRSRCAELRGVLLKMDIP